MADSYPLQQRIDALAARAVRLGVMSLGGGCNRSARDWANILWALDRQRRIPFARIEQMGDEQAYTVLADLSRQWANGLAALQGKPAAQVAA